MVLRTVASESVLNLEAVTMLLEQSAPVIVIGVVVIFHPEIRRGLGRLVQNPLVERVLGAKKTPRDELIRAVVRLQASRTGALIAVERNFGLADYIERGVALDCLVRAELVESIFTKDSPLHDGALVIRGDRIVGARCEFPLSSNPEVARRHGMRHRAALGVTEVNDAVTVVVSEESGRVSACHAGRVFEGLTPAEVRIFLDELMRPPPRKGQMTTTVFRRTDTGVLRVTPAPATATPTPPAAPAPGAGEAGGPAPSPAPAAATPSAVGAAAK